MGILRPSLASGGRIFVFSIRRFCASISRLFVSFSVTGPYCLSTTPTSLLPTVTWDTRPYFNPLPLIFPSRIMALYHEPPPLISHLVTHVSTFTAFLGSESSIATRSIATRSVATRPPAFASQPGVIPFAPHCIVFDIK